MQYKMQRERPGKSALRVARHIDKHIVGRSPGMKNNVRHEATNKKRRKEEVGFGCPQLNRRGFSGLYLVVH